MAPPPQTIYNEQKDFEARCNDRCTSLNTYLVLYEAKNEKGEPVVKKTCMVCPTITHVVCRFPTAVKIELLSDGVVAIAPVISPKLGEETDAEQEAPPKPPTPAPMQVQEPIVQQAAAPVAPVQAPAAPAPAPAAQRRVPFLPGFQLCRLCKHSPFIEGRTRCANRGHRFDKDPATKRCEQFEFM